jgi:hypothetical protein
VRTNDPFRAPLPGFRSLNNPFAYFISHMPSIAQGGRNAKRQDTADWLGPKGEHAVAKRCAQ